MIEKDDWRLVTGPISGREEDLKNITLYRIQFHPLSERWDHEHCVFCWTKFYLHPECLQEGYCTKSLNSCDADWICPECYEDFKEMFAWTLHEQKCQSPKPIGAVTNPLANDSTREHGIFIESILDAAE